MAKQIRSFSDGAITATWTSDWYNWDFETDTTLPDGKTRGKGSIQVAWQNGVGSNDSGDKVQIITTLGGQETIYYETEIASTDNTADCQLYDIDIATNGFKVKVILGGSGLTSLELDISYDKVD